MDLEQHAGLEASVGQLAMDVDHGDFDHVGGAALDGGVDGVSFGSVADGRIRGANIAKVAAAAGDGLDIAVLARKGDGVLHVFADTSELVEVLVNNVGGFLAPDGQA